MDFFLGIDPKIYVMILAAVPFIELRGAIPLGIALDLDPLSVYLLSVIGSTIPAPFLILFFRRILEWMEQKHLFPWLSNFLHRYIHKKSKKLKALSLFGIFLFVAIPLPSTGVYSASALTSLLNVRLKYAFPAILLGNLCAGLIVMILTHIIF